MAVPPTPFDKPALRRTLRTARTAFAGALDAGERQRLEAALAAILVANLRPGMIGGYHACGSEIGVGLPGLAYPRVGGDRLTFHACDTAGLVAGYAGIAEPPAGCAAVEPDVVLVPLVAADRRGNRLGQGAGHYDRTLAALRATRRVLAVGIAWDMQLVDRLPADPWDQPLDALATPTQWLTFGA